MDDITTKLQSVYRDIENAAQRSGRSSDKIRLIGASKKKPASLIRSFHAAGLEDFGENYVQEFSKKQTALTDCNIRWHFFGHLQRNKVKYIIDRVHMIQSVDSPRLARKIQREADKKEVENIDILIQVNVGKEEQKSGVLPRDLPELVSVISDLPSLRLRGFMSLPPFLEPEELRPYHRRLRELRDRTSAENNLDPSLFSELSMGMSRDFSVAVEEGATMVRVGTTLFGPRE